MPCRCFLAVTRQLTQLMGALLLLYPNQKVVVRMSEPSQINSGWRQLQ